MKLLQFAVVIALTMCLSAAGGSSSNSSVPATAAVQVANDPQLNAGWNRAGQYLANNNIVLNAVVLVVHPGIGPDIYAPDERVLSASYASVAVTTLPDLTVAQLQAENPGTTLRHNTDPTGIIRCPLNSEGARYCASYVSSNRVYVASSLKYSDNATGYGMYNIIVARLGYDISKR